MRRLRSLQPVVATNVHNTANDEGLVAIIYMMFNLNVWDEVNNDDVKANVTVTNTRAYAAFHKGILQERLMI